jgi:hypothetical protein
MSELGSARSSGSKVRPLATSAFVPPIADIRNADKPPAAAQNEPSFTLVFVQSGSVPKAIEFCLDSPADAPPA